MKGNSNFESVIEYDNLSHAMDTRVNPLLLKNSRPGFVQESNGDYYSKAQSPNQGLTHHGSSRFSQAVGQNNYQQLRDQGRHPSIKQMQINPSSIPRVNSGNHQSPTMGSQISHQNSRSAIQGGSPNNQLVSAQRGQPSQNFNLPLHPLVDVGLCNCRI